MSSFIRDLSAGTPEMLRAFDDAALIKHALGFEAALARASAAEGLIDAAAADAIAAACASLNPDPEVLARDAAHAGTLAIPLVAQIRRGIADQNAAGAVHLGATSQDLADTALVLQMKEGAALIARDLDRLIAALRSHARRYATTPIVARTLLQPALPTTFGLKCANWLLALREDRARLSRESAQALALQLGGAVGTRDALKGHGGAIAKRMAAALDLICPTAPWHTRRGNIVAFAGALAVLVGDLGKIARDIALMAQAEVGEVSEPAVAGRGGSSAMPHKRNPTGCQIALSAAVRAPGLMSSLLTGSANEHERGLGGWQSEAPVISQLFLIAHGSLAAMVTVAEGMEVHADAMRRNLDRSNFGGTAGEAEALVAEILNAGDGEK